MSTAVQPGRAPRDPEPRRPRFAEPFRFIQPTLPPLETVLAQYRSVYEGGVITNASIVSRFEDAVAERLGVKHCIAVSSCTSGMMMVLRSLDLHGEIIMPSFTFFATGHAAVWNGLTPVFADCDPHTWTVDPADVARKITSRTVAIVGVHLYGNACDVNALTGIAARHRVKLMFDAAHGFGGTYQGKPIGQFGDAEVFSLSPTKLLVAGEGGLVTTNDAKLAHKIRAARNYGDLGPYNPEVLGLNARMPEFNAALGLAGLDLVDRKLRRHNEIAELYTRLLSGTPGLGFQTIPEGHVSTYKDYSVLVDETAFGCSRDELAAALRAENIETKRYFYPPLHEQDLYRQYFPGTPGDLVNTIAVANGVLSLPVYESLPNSTIEGVAETINQIASRGANNARRVQ